MDIINKFYTVYYTVGLKCSACNLVTNGYTDGYRSLENGIFFHTQCAFSDPNILNSYHPQHRLDIKVVAQDEATNNGECKLCKGILPKMYYHCLICDFSIHLICAKKEVLTTIEVPKTHHHTLSLVPEMKMFTCDVCGLPDDRFPYACNLCDLSFHKDCAESTPTLNYSCHPNHTLKRLTRVPSYSDGKCCLCENKLHNVFYHCSICNFSVDVFCAKNPPSFTLTNPKAHDHPLTLMPQRSFVCNACGMEGDPNPYVCPQCNFMIHRNCIDIPSVIKINRHRHLIRYNHRLEVGDWKCGVCHEEIKWTCGAYSCLECNDFAAHWKCATRFGVWDGIDYPLNSSINTIEVKSYEEVGEGEIKHFSHEDHTLKFEEKSDANSEFMRCKACSYPIFSSPFYSCKECDDFILHQDCAFLPKEKADPFYKLRMTLNTDNYFTHCEACHNYFQGFFYKHIEYVSLFLDVRCGSISEPFDHPSHPHSLYITESAENTFCNACGDKATKVLSCEECGFNLEIKCSTLPKMVKHKDDKDHVLSLCYGEKTSEKYWCETCEEELSQDKWFYLCDHCGITLHIRCTLGDFIWFKPLGDAELTNSNGMIHNSHTTRPICYCCKLQCQFPTVFHIHGNIFCSQQCLLRSTKKIV